MPMLAREAGWAGLGRARCLPSSPRDLSCGFAQSHEASQGQEPGLAASVLTPSSVPAKTCASLFSLGPSAFPPHPGHMLRGRWAGQVCYVPGTTGVALGRRGQVCVLQPIVLYPARLGLGGGVAWPGWVAVPTAEQGTYRSRSHWNQPAPWGCL